MASRRPSKTRDELHIEELDDSENEARPARSGPPARPAAPARGGTEATLLQVFGVVGLVAGLGLWLGAGFNDSLADVAGALGDASLHPGTLIVVGLMVLAFGRVRRAQVEMARHTSSNDDGLLEQVATTQVHVRHSLERLARAHSELVASLGVVRDQVQLVVQTQQKPDDDATDQEAIFRLAASLDQLGARMEQRLQEQLETFHNGLRQVGTEIVAAQSEMRSYLEQLPAELPGAAAGDPWSEPLPQPAVPDQVPAEQQPEPELDELAGAMPAGGGEMISSLGVLDTIPDEDPGPHPPLGGGVVGAPANPHILHQSASGGIQKTDFHSPAERAMELDTQTKLTQLKDLLADDRLREALEDMRRTQ